MNDIQKITAAKKDELELLEAAGFYNVEALAKVDATELFNELNHANSVLHITKTTPSLKVIERWISSARKEFGTNLAPKTPSEIIAVNHEKAPQVAQMLARAPFAIPLPARVLVKNDVSVDDIPPGLLLNRYSGDLDVRVDKMLIPQAPTRVSSKSGNIRLADNSQNRHDFDASRIKSIDTLAGAAPAHAKQNHAPADSRVALMRSPRPETNQGISPSSRRFIRGILHTHPTSVAVGAAITLLLMMMLPLSAVSSILLLLSDQWPEKFIWVPMWLLVFPCSLPLLGIAYAIWGQSASCRVCGQKQFVPKLCIKNAKAHHIPGMGNIIPTCLHILLFQWFRCIYCATPARLKE